MERIYHRFEYWECYKAGLYSNKSNLNKENLALKVVEFFEDSLKTKQFMIKVIEEWKYSCEHNLSNISLNRIAWLGQAACCIYAKIPYKVTMESWRLVNELKRNEACFIAEEIITNYERTLIKNKQICLKFI